MGSNILRQNDVIIYNESLKKINDCVMLQINPINDFVKDIPNNFDVKTKSTNLLYRNLSKIILELCGYSPNDNDIKLKLLMKKFFKLYIEFEFTLIPKDLITLRKYYNNLKIIYYNFLINNISNKSINPPAITKSIILTKEQKYDYYTYINDIANQLYYFKNIINKNNTQLQLCLTYCEDLIRYLNCYYKPEDVSLNYVFIQQLDIFDDLDLFIQNPSFKSSFKLSYDHNNRKREFKQLYYKLTQNVKNLTIFYHKYIESHTDVN